MKKGKRDIAVKMAKTSENPRGRKMFKLGSIIKRARCSYDITDILVGLTSY